MPITYQDREDLRFEEPIPDVADTLEAALRAANHDTTDLSVEFTNSARITALFEKAAMRTVAVRGFGAIAGQPAATTFHTYIQSIRAELDGLLNVRVGGVEDTALKDAVVDHFISNYEYALKCSALPPVLCDAFLSLGDIEDKAAITANFQSIRNDLDNETFLAEVRAHEDPNDIIRAVLWRLPSNEASFGLSKILLKRLSDQYDEKVKSQFNIYRDTLQAALDQITHPSEFIRRDQLQAELDGLEDTQQRFLDSYHERVSACLADDYTHTAARGDELQALLTEMHGVSNQDEFVRQAKAFHYHATTTGPNAEGPRIKVFNWEPINRDDPAQNEVQLTLFHDGTPHWEGRGAPELDFPLFDVDRQDIFNLRYENNQWYRIWEGYNNNAPTVEVYNAHKQCWHTPAADEAEAIRAKYPDFKRTRSLFDSAEWLTAFPEGSTARERALRLNLHQDAVLTHEVGRTDERGKIAYKKYKSSAALEVDKDWPSTAPGQSRELADKATAAMSDFIASTGALLEICEQYKGKKIPATIHDDLGNRIAIAETYLTRLNDPETGYLKRLEEYAKLGDVKADLLRRYGAGLSEGAMAGVLRPNDVKKHRQRNRHLFQQVRDLREFTAKYTHRFEAMRDTLQKQKDALEQFGVAKTYDRDTQIRLFRFDMTELDQAQMTGGSLALNRNSLDKCFRTFVGSPLHSKAAEEYLSKQDRDALGAGQAVDFYGVDKQRPVTRAPNDFGSQYRGTYNFTKGTYTFDEEKAKDSMRRDGDKHWIKDVREREVREDDGSTRIEKVQVPSRYAEAIRGRKDGEPTPEAAKNLRMEHFLEAARVMLINGGEPIVISGGLTSSRQQEISIDMAVASAAMIAYDPKTGKFNEKALAKGLDLEWSSLSGKAERTHIVREAKKYCKKNHDVLARFKANWPDQRGPNRGPKPPLGYTGQATERARAFRAAAKKSNLPTPKPPGAK